jgi:small subunit ribosomal protein S17
MADENQNPETESEETEADAAPAEETVSAPEGPVAPASAVDDAVPGDEPAPAEAQAAEAEAPAEEPAAEESVADAEPPPDVEAEAAAAEAPPAGEADAPAAETGPKKKRKRLPRAQRHKHSKPRRERPTERNPITREPKPEHVRGRRQERRGVVVSSAADKTIVVRVDAVKAHRKYKKVVRRSTKFHAHDEQNQANVGDVVRIVETRPLSKTKNWRLVEIVEAAR